MIEGLWTVQFARETDEGGWGVVVFETLRIFGGDIQFYYVGSYEAKHDCIEMTLKVSKYHHELGIDSIFGDLDNFVVRLKGVIQGNEMTITGHLDSDPSETFMAHAVKRAELPG